MKNNIKEIIQYVERKIQHRASYLVIVLASIGIFTTLLISFFGRVVKGNSSDFQSEFWNNLTFLMDAAKLAEISAPFPDLFSFFLMIIMTIIGILVFSTLIAVISQIVDEKISEVRSGISPVRSESHTLIIGYSKKVPLLIRDASQDDNRLEFVIYSDYDEESMRLDLADTFQSHKVLFKKGVSKRQNHGKYLNLNKARSVLIIAEKNSLTQEQNDVTNLQIMISLIESEEWQLNPCRISVEVYDPNKYYEAIRYCETSFPWIQGCIPTMLHVTGLKTDLLASLIKSPKAFQFITSLLGFDGDDFHFLNYRDLVSINNSFHAIDLLQLNNSLGEAICIGYLLDDSEYLSGGNVDLASATYLKNKNPPLKAGMTTIFLAKSRSELVAQLSNISLKSSNTQVKVDHGVIHEKIELNTVCVLVNSMELNSLTRFITEILLQNPYLESVKIYLSSTALGIDNESIRESLSVEIDHLESAAERSGYYLNRDHNKLGISALPVRVSALEGDADSEVTSLYKITQVENSIKCIVDAGITEGNYLIAILAAKKGSVGRETVEKWSDYFSSVASKDDPRGLFFEGPRSNSHSLIVLRLQKSINLALEAAENWDLVVVWSENLYGEVRITPIDPLQIQNPHLGSNKLGMTQEFPKLDNVEFNIEVVDDFVKFLKDKSFYHDDVVVWANDEVSDDDLSIDPISERFLWNLLSSDCFSVMSTYDDIYDYLVDSIDEIIDDTEKKIEKGEGTLENELEERQAVMFFVSNAFTSNRINNIKAFDNLDICSFEENAFASRMISSLSNDPIYSIFFGALSTGELSFELFNTEVKNPMTLRALLIETISMNIGVPIGYRLTSSNNLEYESLAKNFDITIRGSISLIVVCEAQKRKYFAPTNEL